MAGNLIGKAAVVIGAGDDAHRGAAMAIAAAGADIAVVGVAPELSAEAALHSISNEIWALGRRSIVVKLETDDAPGFAAAVQKAMEELGRADLVVRVSAVLNA